MQAERFSLPMVILINATHIFVNYKVNSKLVFIISQTNYIYHITLQCLIILHKKYYFIYNYFIQTTYCV